MGIVIIGILQSSSVLPFKKYSFVPNLLFNFVCMISQNQNYCSILPTSFALCKLFFLVFPSRTTIFYLPPQNSYLEIVILIQKPTFRKRGMETTANKQIFERWLKSSYFFFLFQVLCSIFRFRTKEVIQQKKQKKQNCEGYSFSAYDLLRNLYIYSPFFLLSSRLTIRSAGNKEAGIIREKVLCFRRERHTGWKEKSNTLFSSQFLDNNRKPE